MRTSRTRLAVRAALSVLVLVATSMALAQDPNLTPISQPVAVAAPTRDGGIGEGSFVTAPNGVAMRRSQTWIDATKFGGRLSTTAPQLSYFTYQYYNSPGSAGNEGYFAPVELEPGVSVDTVTCIYNNSSATNNFNGSFQKFSTDFSTNPPSRSVDYLVSWSGTLNEGIAYKNAVLAAPETIKYFVNPLLANTYHLRVDVAGDTSFSGCFVFWTRQIPPAPGSATFSDVPVGSIFFQFVEALYASGITAGCGGGNFCPNTAVTRGQMAVFLATALGLYWNY